MMLCVREEREGEWALHVYQMLPYFFAVGCHNYARYGLYYLCCMDKLPQDVEERFMKCEHVMRHLKGLWNAIWSDIFIETIFMRYGKGPGGLIAVTLKAEVVQKWASSLHICTHGLKVLDEMR